MLCVGVGVCWHWIAHVPYSIVRSYVVTKGDSFSTSITKQETELTPEMIARYGHMSSTEEYKDVFMAVDLEWLYSHHLYTCEVVSD